jgi:hypothetical protein
MHTDRCGNACRQKCCAKGSGKEVKIQEFVYRDTTNVEPEMYDYTSNNTGQQISKNFCICDEYVINLFVCIYEVRKETLKITWL